MLVLTRYAGQYIAIGQDIDVWLIEINGSQARLGVQAPRAISIHRSEIAEANGLRTRLTAPIVSHDEATLGSRLSHISRALGALCRNHGSEIAFLDLAWKLKQEIDAHMGTLGNAGARD